jgi:hypothetical protein
VHSIAGKISAYLSTQGYKRKIGSSEKIDQIKDVFIDLVGFEIMTKGNAF